jgi:hypothetical protein
VKTVFLSDLCILYQGRLGTNVGKALKKECRFLAGGEEATGACREVRNAVFLLSVLYKNAIFAKAGSGQTYERRIAEEKRHFFECFPYVCPGPVLVK